MLRIVSFGVGLHVMVALAYNEGEWVSSAALGQSIRANPVTVRRVVGQLVQAGLVETQTGPGGGARLTKAAKHISVDDVFEALGRPSFVDGHDRDPVDSCAVSECMPRVFTRLNAAIEKKALAVMKSTTLRTLVDEELRS